VEGQFSGDPMVREAQRQAYERAVARQRAAELAAQQQAALQELQQTQRMYEGAQRKLQEQEQRQRALQEEYHKKSVAEAYEALRMAQQKYYDLMGVSQETGGSAQQGPQQQAAAATPGAQYPQQQVQYPQQAQTYGSAVQQPQGYPAGVMGAPQWQSPYGVPQGQPTPLHVTGQEQQSGGGGLWSALKEFLAPTNSVMRPQQSTLDDTMR
jgi:hypothetical protein